MTISDNTPRLIMVVAQEPFEDRQNTFCKLVPGIFVNGMEPETMEFPNDGEIWWMVTPQAACLARPGYLVTGDLEEAVRYEQDIPDSSRYQVVRESVRQLDTREGLELIDIPGDLVTNKQDLVSLPIRLRPDQRVGPRVLVRMRGEVIGPFSTPQQRYGVKNETPVDTISLTPSNPDMSVFVMKADMFARITSGFLIHLTPNISTTSQRRAENPRVQSVRHDVLLGAGYEKFLAQNPEQVVLEPLDRKLNRFAKNCLTRKKRQELQQLLQDLEVTGRENKEAEDLFQAIERVKHRLIKQDDSLNTVAQALLKSGILGEDRIKNAEKGFGEAYVQEKTAQLQAAINDQLKARRDEVRQIEAKLLALQSQHKQAEQVAKERAYELLAKERAKANQEMAAEQANLARQRQELDLQRRFLEANLVKVTADLKEAGDDVVNRFLTIAPLIGVLHPLRDQVVTHATQGSNPSFNKQVSLPEFKLPAFIHKTASEKTEELTESEFFQRFVKLVEDSGFQYRNLDLQRFHISIKTGSITVLGGPSGIGKSSLPQLYGRALAGADNEPNRPGSLMINVNPSWMDVHDLLYMCA